MYTGGTGESIAVNMSTPLRCPAGMTTLTDGTFSFHGCVCGEENYFDKNTQKCESCPEGFECDGKLTKVTL